MESPPPFNWLLAASYLLSAGGCAAATFALAVWIRRATGADWRLWALGAATFLLTQVATRLPIVLGIQALPPVQRLLAEPWFLWSFTFLLAFTAGLFEEGGRAACWRWFISPGQRTWAAALMLGAGHGGFEALLIGLLQALALVNYLALTFLPPTMLGVEPEAAAAALQPFHGLAGWEPLLGGWERLSTLVLHLAFSVVVLQAFRRHAGWWFAALAGHTAANLAALGMLRWFTAWWGASLGAIGAELGISVLALAGAGVVFAFRDPPPVAAEILEPDPAGP